MAEDLAEFYQEWDEARGVMREVVPNVMRGFGGFNQAVMKEGALSVPEKELVALAIGVAVPCAACIKLHVRACLKAGATREQILEAAGVSVVMGGGPALTQMPVVMAALKHLEDEA